MSIQGDDYHAIEHERPRLIPVDNFSHGKSPWQTAKACCAQLIRNPLFYLAIVIFIGLVKVTSLGDHPMPTNLNDAIRSSVTDTHDDAIKLFMWQDEQCRSMAGKPLDDTCEGPPYLYMSFHGSKNIRNHGYTKKIHQVCKFSRDGCGLGAVLMPNTDGYHPSTMRAISIHPKSGELYVVDAYRKSSQVRAYSQCNDMLDGRREPLRTIMEGGADDPGLVHPYGITISPINDEVYVSTQGTYGVLRYGPHGKIKHRSQYLVERLEETCPKLDVDAWGCTDVSTPDASLFKEITSSAFNSTNINKRRRREISKYVFPNSFAIIEEADVRGVVADKRGNIFVANKKQGIQVYDINGNPIHNIKAIKDTAHGIHSVVPVSMIYDETKDVIWTGCARSHALMCFHAETFELVEVMHFATNVVHPIGLQIVDDAMFLVSQGTGELLKVDMNNRHVDESGRQYTQSILRDLLDTGEFVIASDC